MNAKQLLQVIKSGNAAADFAIGGSLLPDQARKWYDLVVDQSAFLKDITVVYGKKLTIPLNAYNISNRQLVRVDEGSEPSSDQKASASNSGKNMTLQPVQIFYDLPFQTIEDNQDNPQFESMIATMIAKQFASDLLDLGTNGTDDDYTESAFLELNEGWVQLAKDDSNTVKINTNGDATLTASFEKAIKGATDKYKTPEHCIIVGPADYEEYRIELGGKDSTAAMLKDGTGIACLGYKLKVNPFLPEGTFFFANPKDLVLGLNLGIKKYREVNARKRAIEYTYDLANDYELLRDHAVTIGYDAG